MYQLGGIDAVERVLRLSLREAGDFFLVSSQRCGLLTCNANAVLLPIAHAFSYCFGVFEDRAFAETK